MAVVEAILTYRPVGLGEGHTVPLGLTSDVRALRAVRDALLAQSRADADLWRNVDPGLLAMKQAESERLARVLAILLPDEELRADLRLVAAQPSRDGDRR